MATTFDEEYWKNEIINARQSGRINRYSLIGVKNQRYLKEIAEKAHIASVRIVAVRHLNDPDFLIKLSRSEQSPNVCTEIFDRFIALAGGNEKEEKKYSAEEEEREKRFCSSDERFKRFCQYYTYNRMYDIDYLRECISRIKNQRYLVIIATKTPTVALRVEAAKNINDGEILKEMLVNIHYNDTDKVAKILLDKACQNQKLAKMISTNNVYPIAIRIKAIKNIEDINFLARLYYETNCDTEISAAIKKAVAESIIHKTTDGGVNQALLMQILQDGTCLDAVKFIKDDDILSKVFSSAKGLGMRLKILEVLCDSGSMVIPKLSVAEILKIHDEKILKFILTRIDDSTMLKMLAKKKNPEEKIVAFIDKVNGNDMLRALIMYPYFSYISLEEWTDLILCLSVEDVKIAKNIRFDGECSGKKYKFKDVISIIDEEKLFEIAINSRNTDILFHCVNNIKSSELLTQIVYYVNNSFIEYCAIERINNKKILHDIEIYHHNPETRRCAKHRIKDLS